VYEVVSTAKEHLSAEEVRQVLTHRGIALPRSSVNNVLGTLAAAGLIGRVDTLPGPARFESDSTDHDHFWCDGCRLVANVSGDRGSLPPVPGTVTSTAVTYLGRCDACRSRNSAASRTKLAKAVTE
jgi:Fe2+ or Zn2+ uptake regulation protein